MSRIAIVGSRGFADLAMVRFYMANYVLPGDLVISGGAEGVDREAERVHLGSHGTVRVIRPDWKQHGKAAGPIRNAQIVREADRVVAFWDGTSRGTRSTIDEALKQRKHLEVVFAPSPSEESGE